jgi:hypothetical protein
MALHMSFYNPLIGFTSSARKPPPVLADFPLMKEFQSSGQFWLPNKPEQALWGKLHYMPGASTGLALDGSFPIRSENFAIPEIHGRLFTGAPCVLKDAWGSVESFHAKDTTFRTILHSKLFLYGLDPPTSSVDSFSMSTLKFSHLNDWFDRPLSLDYPPEKSFEECLVRFKPDQNEGVAEFEGTPFKLDVFCTRTIPVEAGSQSVEFGFGYTLRIFPSLRMPLAWHLGVAAMLRELFMLLVGTGVYTLEMKVLPGKTPQEGVAHVFPTIAVPMLVRLDRRYFYSQHRSLKQHFPTLLATWAREQERLAVVRHTLSDLLTVDGISPEAVFMRVVQTMEYFHGLLSSDEERYVPKPVWRSFTGWLAKQFPDCWSEGSPDDRSKLLEHKTTLIRRIQGVNTLSFRTRIQFLFDAVPARELMPLLDNPRDATEYLNILIPRIEGSRHYLTHFNPDQRKLAFTANELEAPTLQCWSILVFNLIRFLGLDNELAGDIALAARRTMFLVGTNAYL